MATLSSPGTSVKPPRHSKEKRKKKVLPVPVISSGRNEGPDPDWAYQPPDDAELEEAEADMEEFDWGTINESEDLELWLIRVPESIKPKYLENVRLDVDLPPSSKSEKIGSIKRKHATFDIWSVGEDDDQLVGGEEIKSISCLLPRKGTMGNLFPAPKPIARHLVVSAQAVLPTPDTTTQAAEKYKKSPRQCHPQELLNHKFLPYGYLAQCDIEDIEMESDTLVPKKTIKAVEELLKSPKAGDESKAKKSRTLKDRTETQSPRKSKKAKR